ncbi:MAG: HAD-IA family hydrolase [Nitrospirales bacterium]|nr:HAD-IA family hydrolase [Nitrospira sp.]MDR4462022.1 HAD-IA family hydrolase [Nitrospirales bacterium]
MNSSPIKVIFFDAVGTLFDVKGSVGEVYLAYAKKYGVPDTEHTQLALNAAFKQTMKDMPLPIFSVERPEKLKQCERLWWFDVVHAVFYRVGMFEGFDDFFEEVFEAFGKPTHWELFPETLEVLAELKGRGFELGIISNFDSRFFQVSRGLGLNTFFDSVSISSLVGAAKPAQNIFDHALDEHMVIPQEALHVGDHPIEDFEGARQAGLHAVLIDRSTNSLPHPQTLSNLTQLSSYDLLYP